MVTINIFCIGKLKEKYLSLACDEYCKRMGPFAKLTVCELPEYKLPAQPSKAEISQAIEMESNSIIERILPHSYTITLCIEGKQIDSVALSDKIGNIALSGISKINFVIGGSFGLSSSIKQKSDFCLSMSKMTFPHQLARVMLLEQIYRAFQINSGGKYHK